MKKITLMLILAIISISCQSKKEKELNEKSLSIFNNSVEIIKKSEYIINVDSFRVIYEKSKEENSQTGLEFSNRFKIYAEKLLKNKEDEDFLKNVRDGQRRERQIKKENENRKVWKNSKYGKLQKKHPEWTDDECTNVIDKKIWIGMSLEMLKYQRGKPNRANPSNYGNGTHWQWCWDDYTPSCFYGEEDGIITSYN